MKKTRKQNSKGSAFVNFIWKDKRQRARNAYYVMTVIFVAAAILLTIVNGKLNLISIDNENNNPVDPTGEPVSVSKLEEDEEFDMISSIDYASSYNDFIYKWATNEDSSLRKSKNVLNILLIGLDSEDAIENGGRSDTLILASLNKKTQKIYLTSFFRDTWTYMNIRGNDSFNKINATYYYGGDDALIDTLERDMKIDIDYYVAVDFSSFTDIINALGGLTVEVQDYEAEYINRTTVHTIESGPAVKLNGYEALVFARIRHSDSDSDVSRTRRQRQVISALINSAKGATISQLNAALDSLFKYVKTDLTKMQLLSYGTQALAGGWANYEIEQVTLSDPEIFQTGYVGSQAVVFVDFPAVAEKVQTAIYGDSNVVNDENSIRPFNFLVRRADGQLSA